MAESMRSTGLAALRSTNLPPPLSSTPRKPTPSPLQTTQISSPSPIAPTFGAAAARTPGSPRLPGSAGHASHSSGSQGSPRSPPASSSPRSIHEALGADLIGTQAGSMSEEPVEAGAVMTGGSPATPKGDTQRMGPPPPPPTASTPSSADGPSRSPTDPLPHKTKAALQRPEPRAALRTSSIDSTMSSVSSTTTYSHVSTQPDPLSPNPAEIAAMIATAGSPETLIRQLVKEKKHVAGQNAKLWGLVGDQRGAILDLKQKLDQAAVDKDRYRRRLRDHAPCFVAKSGSSASHREALKGAHPSASPSPAPSEEVLPFPKPPTDTARKGRPSGPVERNGADEEVNGGAMNGRPLTTILKPVPDLASETSSPGSSQRPSPDAGDNDDDDRRNTIIQSAPMKAVAPLEIRKKAALGVDTDLARPHGPHGEVKSPSDVPSPSSFSMRRSATNPRKAGAGGGAEADPASPGDNKAAISPSIRKAPPAPLNLNRSPELPTFPRDPAPAADEHSDSEYEEVVEVDELPAFERGRKKTRAEDDREREIILQREQESRSQSKKKKQSQPRSKSNKDAAASAAVEAETAPSPPKHGLPKSPAIRGFAPPAVSSPRSLDGMLSPQTSLAGVLSAHSTASQSTSARSVTAAPMSPGLPMSPRPSDRPMNSPPPRPRQPRDGYLNSPPQSARLGAFSPPLLSPRAPRTPLPVPVAPGVNSLTSPPLPRTDDTPFTNMSRPRSPTSTSSHKQRPSASSHHSHHSHHSEPKSPQSPVSPFDAAMGNKLSKPKPGSKLEAAEVYRGLVSEAYPDLLLPPNALPLIFIKVTSSRVRPSRHSILSLKSDENPTFVLGVSLRSDECQLWRVEKPASALQSLYQNMSQACPLDVAMPDKHLFTGTSPAKVNARREVLEDFFDRLLDTPMNDKAGLILCQFLSTHVSPPDEAYAAAATGLARPGSTDADQTSTHSAEILRPAKEGYLTKRGKNFGGWKARYFVLADATLRYFDSPGGPLSGTIRLTQAQIGRQSRPANESSPARAATLDADAGEVRHAFLILEPKRRDSKHVVRHVLCADSDAERDAWVNALIQHVGQLPSAETNKALADPKTPSATTSSKSSILSSVMRGARDESERRVATPAESDTASLQGLSYEDTAPGQLPLRNDPTPPIHDSPSPRAASFGGSSNGTTPSARTISAPRDGAKIQDAGAWGNRALESPRVVAAKDPKKRHLWGFRGGGDHDAAVPATPARPPANQRPVFGLPLAEAVRLHPAHGPDVTDPHLPSILHRCLQYLTAQGAEMEEGLFRLSGSNTLVRQLRDRFNAEGDLDFAAEGGGFVDVHAVASLLKQYLRELPDMVLTRELHLQFLQILGMFDVLFCWSACILPPCRSVGHFLC